MAVLSVIVTAYNIEHYIDQCLRSVAAQTLHDIEVLVVDDGSTDGTAERISAFAARDPRFIPILLGENSPGGVATAANVGLERATGDWVGFADGDDYLEPGMFEALLDAAVTYDTDLAMCQYREVSEDGTEYRDPADIRRWSGLVAGRHYLDVAATKRFLRFIAVPWRKLYRRSVLEDNLIRFPVGDHFYEDNPFHWFCLLSAGSIAVVPHVLCYHRVGRVGQTMTNGDARLFTLFAHHATIRDWLRERALLDLYSVSLLEWVISQAEWIGPRTPKELRPQLFSILRPIIAEYPPEILARALHEGRKGDFAQVFTSALATGNATRFARSLDSRPDTSSRIRLGVYHLRHSGFRHTWSLTRQTVTHRFGTTQAGKMLARQAPSANPAAGPQGDLMFGLMVLQQRLDEIEAKLDRLSPGGSADHTDEPPAEAEDPDRNQRPSGQSANEPPEIRS